MKKHAVSPAIKLSYIEKALKDIQRRRPGWFSPVEINKAVQGVPSLKPAQVNSAANGTSRLRRSIKASDRNPSYRIFADAVNAISAKHKP